MEWLFSALKEASKVKRNFVRRLKHQDDYSEFFCSRNFNRYGHYTSIVSMQNKRRFVIIIPKLTFNTGWLDIAHKIAKFINGSEVKPFTTLSGKTEEGLLYLETSRRNKLITREMEKATVQERDGIIYISEELSFHKMSFYPEA